jgi:alpha-L-fucosidase
LGWPADGELTIQSLAQGTKLASGEVAGARLLGHDDELKWSRDEKGLTIQLPEKRPGDYAFTFKITGLTP